VWEWDGVRFEFLHPQAAEAGAARRNNLSCVLRVSSAGGSMLLTGDIERQAENALVQKSASLKAEVLLVPHHGSRTSSTPGFIAAVAPRWAVVAVGYRSRFGHPNAEVLGRYRAAGASIVRTDLDGAVQVRLMDMGVQVNTERSSAPRYWRAAPPV
jgi:competence protein ComEC